MCLVPKQKKRCLEDALTCSEGSGEEEEGEVRLRRSRELHGAVKTDAQVPALAGTVLCNVALWLRSKVYQDTLHALMSYECFGNIKAQLYLRSLIQQSLQK